MPIGPTSHYPGLPHGYPIPPSSGTRVDSTREGADMTAGMLHLIIQLVAGAMGGNIAGNALKQFDLGALGNSIAGDVGGGIGGQLLSMALGTGGRVDVGSVVAQIAGGGVGGGVLLAIIGLIRQIMGGGAEAA